MTPDPLSDSTPATAAPFVSLDEQLTTALTNDCATELDETDIANVVAAVLPVILGPHQRVVWVDDNYGYRCPACYVFLTVPRRVPDPICPTCRKGGFS